MCLTAEDIITITAAGNSVSISPDGSMVISPVALAKRPLTDAERAKACRDRKASRRVTENVTPSGEASRNVTKIVTNVTENPAPPSPPPLPPTPPNPAPTPAGNTRVCEAPEIPDFEAPKPKRFPLSQPVASALQTLHRRRPTTPWGPKEIAAARLLTRIPEAQLLADLELFAKARTAGFQFYRRDVLTLLNNWQAEVERSQDFLQTLTTNPKHGNDSRTSRAPVSRNVEPLAANRPSLNAPGATGLATPPRPDPDRNGKSLW